VRIEDLHELITDASLMTEQHQLGMPPVHQAQLAARLARPGEVYEMEFVEANGARAELEAEQGIRFRGGAQEAAAGVAVAAAEPPRGSTEAFTKWLEVAAEAGDATEVHRLLLAGRDPRWPDTGPDTEPSWGPAPARFVAVWNPHWIVFS
jgi:hypothetical protein